MINIFKQRHYLNCVTCVECEMQYEGQDFKFWVYGEEKRFTVQIILINVVVQFFNQILIYHKLKRIKKIKLKNIDKNK